MALLRSHRLPWLIDRETEPTASSSPETRFFLLCLPFLKGGHTTHPLSKSQPQAFSWYHLTQALMTDQSLFIFFFNSPQISHPQSQFTFPVLIQAITSSPGTTTQERGKAHSSSIHRRCPSPSQGWREASLSRLHGQTFGGRRRRNVCVLRTQQEAGPREKSFVIG